jgi:hypothetical protein
MSEVAARASASRGRGSGRGGRGGFAGRGGRRPNGDKPEHKAGETPAAFEDDGDVGGLRKQYGDKTSIIREMFPDWSEVDVLFALQETNGDQEEAVTRIAEGTSCYPSKPLFYLFEQWRACSCASLACSFSPFSFAFCESSLSL